MSVRERCAALLDTFTDSQLADVAAMLQSMRQNYDDMEENAFCEKMVQDYEKDPDKDNPIPIEDFARQLGITL